MNKILLVNNGYPSKENPTFTTYIKTIKKCLEGSGNKVELLSIFYNKPINKFIKLEKYSIFWLRCLIINLKKYDVIYINHPTFCFPILFNLTIKKKYIILHWHGNDLVGKTLFHKIINKIIKQKALENINIVPSKYFKSKLISFLSKKDSKIFISPSGGVNTNLFKPKELSKIPNTINIGFAAELNINKGADILEGIIHKKQIIEKYFGKKVIFNIINYGEKASIYIENYLSFTKDINIWPKMNKEDMPNFYNSNDMLIFPSKREAESLGLVALEALSCNVPVITFNQFAFPEFIVPKNTGELVNFNSSYTTNILNFINMIIKVIENYQSYKPRNLILNKYSEDSVINFYKKIFNNL